MRIYILILATIFLFSFTGCEERNKTNITTTLTEKQKLIEIEDLNQIKSLDHTSTIKGIDSNHNGVRDDIEAYISNTYIQEELRSAVLQAAKAMQEALLVDKTDPIAVEEIANKNIYAMKCLYSKFAELNSQKEPALACIEIEAMTTNTVLRLNEYLKLNKALNGKSWSWPVGDTCQ